MTEQHSASLTGQPCPICGENQLTLREEEREVPYFNRMFIFSMTCGACKYNKSDIEALDFQDPVKFSIEVEKEEDLKIRIIKSAQATVKIPRIITIESTPSSNGYITNVEGVINRVMNVIEQARDSEEDKETKKKAKNLLKKLNKVLWGQEKIKIIIEDPSGNSAIISEKAVKGKL